MIGSAVLMKKVGTVFKGKLPSIKKKAIDRFKIKKEIKIMDEIPKSSIISKNISQKQLRHIKGRPEYRGGGFLQSLDDAQAVLDAYHSGRVIIIGKSPQGFPVVKFKGVVGTNINLSAGYYNQPTNIFMIKGTTSPSIVPMSPNWRPR